MPMDEEEATSTPAFVRAACVHLWAVRDPEQAAAYLRRLRQAILRDRLDAYDPSEVFLAIQGIVLRFSPENARRSSEEPDDEAPAELERQEIDEAEMAATINSSRNNNQDSKQENESQMSVRWIADVNLLWSVLYEAVCAAAALVCACVGPAWSRQLARRRVICHLHSARRRHSLGDQHQTQGTLHQQPTRNHSFSNIDHAFHHQHHHHHNHHQHHQVSHVVSSTNNLPVISIPQTSFPQPRATDGSTIVKLPDSDRFPSVLPLAMVGVYPHIPEILPAAVLRFTKTSLEHAVVFTRDPYFVKGQMPFVEAQLLLVQQLCCCRIAADGQMLPPPPQPFGEWIIPGAHEAVGSVLSYGLRLVSSKRKSLPLDEETTRNETTAPSTRWNHALLVTRATNDLLSEGWQPLSRTYMGEDVVLSLLVIAQQGIASDDDRHEVNNRKAWEDRLVAASCAAQAVMALASLGLRGVIPEASQTTVVRAVCRLHVMASELKEIPINANNPEELTKENQQQVKYFKAQKETCLISTANLLRALLSQESSAGTTMEVLLSLIRAVINTLAGGRKEAANKAADGHQQSSSQKRKSSKPGDNQEVTKYLLMDASCAVRIISGALWGEPHGYEPILLLRIYWGAALETFHRLSSAIYANLSSNSDNFESLLRPLLADTVLAFGRVIESEIRGGTGMLSAVEWDAIILCIEESIIPWVQITDSVVGKNQLDRDDQQHNLQVSGKERWIDRSTLFEIESFLLRLSILLDKCVENESSPLWDYASQKRLYLMILQRAVPWIDPTTARAVGKSAFRAWAKFGFFPFVLEKWKETASELLGEAFAANQNDNSYRHCPTVRLAALQSLTFEDPGAKSSKSVAEEQESSGDWCASLSLLGIVENLRELYLEILSNCIIPTLEIVFPLTIVNEYERNGLRASEQTHVEPRSHREILDLSTEDATELDLYAVKLVGRVFLGVTGDRRHRALFVCMLQSASIEDRFPASVKAEALRQLDACLRSTFCELPHAQDSIPDLINALCAIIRAASPESILQKEQSTTPDERVALAIYAVRILARLEMTAKSQLAMRVVGAQEDMTEVERGSHDAGGRPTRIKDSKPEPKGRYKPMIASFVSVKEATGDGRSEGGRSLVSFDLISRELFQILSAHRRSVSYGTSESLVAHLRMDCLDALRSYMLSGAELNVSMLRDDFCGISNGEVTTPDELEDAFARTRALSKCAQAMFASRAKAMVDEPRASNPSKASLPQEAGGIVKHLLLQACKSTDDELLIEGCRALGALLLSLEAVAGRSLACNVYGLIQTRLRVEVENWTSEKENLRASIALLGLLDDIVSNWKCLDYSGQMLDTFRLCMDILTKTDRAEKNYLFYMVLGCLLTLAQRFCPEDTAKAAAIVEGSMKQHYWDNLPEAVCLGKMIVLEALERSSRNNADSSPTSELYAFARHEVMAKDTDLIDNFPAEGHSSSSRYSHPSAAWLCQNNVLFCCRVGSSSSRYRGWVEVVLRSPTTRLRSLVAIPSRVTLKNPDFLSKFWDPPQLGSSSRNDRAKQPTPKLDVEPRDNSSAILDKARALIKRFDDMFAASDADPIHPTYSATDPNEDETFSFETGASTTQSSSGIVGASNLTTTSRSESPDSYSMGSPNLLDDVDEHSIEKWFMSIFAHNNGVLPTDCSNLDACLDCSAMSMSQDDGVSYQLEDYTFTAPQQLQHGPRFERAVSILDRATAIETHKIALLYAGDTESLGETTESLLLNVVHCSPLFHKFCCQIGHMCPTRHLKYYSAGLDVSKYESDGKYTLIWCPEGAIRAVVFHIANLMPVSFNSRKRHVGNDNVLIVFVDKGSFINVGGYEAEDGEGSVISGQFNFVTIFVVVLPQPEMLRISVEVRSGLSDDVRTVLSDLAVDELVSVYDAPTYVRGLAMRADLACRVMVDDLSPPSNFLERCKQLDSMRRYLVRR